MFGYVRPLRCELKVRELDTFRAVYCGLCHTLAHRYGWWARYLLGYDFAFLALALSAYGDAPTPCRRRCPASPLRKKNIIAPDEALEAAADLTVLLSVYKFRDTVSDEGLWKSLAARGMILISLRGGRRAESWRPEVAFGVNRQLLRLKDYEKENIDAIDAPADTFAEVLASLSSAVPDEVGRRVLRSLFYHLGRWIYLVDACDDMTEDARRGTYNPVAARFALADGQWNEEAKTKMADTVMQSRVEMECALALLPDTPATPVLHNIILFGLPFVEEQVLNGLWRRRSTRYERPI